jgi:ribosomal protein S6--L-glutamate ligase
MKIGIVTVEDRTYHPNRRLLEAASRKGHHLSLIHPYRFHPEISCGKLGLRGIESDRLPDVILPRQGATVGESSLALISHLALMGIPMVNSLHAILLSRHQFLTLQVLSRAGLPVPDTFMVNSPEGVREAVSGLGGVPVVVKQTSGRQGEGVVLVRSDQEAEEVAQHGLDKYKGLLIQRFIPPEGRRDIRVLVIGNRMAGCMELRPEPGDFRANFHLTGKSLAVDIDPVQRQIAQKASAALGLDIAGVDLVVDREGRTLVIEVNYSPGFKGLEAATGLDIAGSIVDFAAQFG